MNQHVDRRSLLAGIAVAPAAAINSATAEPASNLTLLEATFQAEWTALKALEREHDDAEQLYFSERGKLAKPEMRPATPEEIDAIGKMTIAELREGMPLNGAAREHANATRAYNKADAAVRRRTGFAKIDRAYQRQVERTCTAADNLLHCPAETLGDLAAKVRVHKMWEYDCSALDFIMDDIARVAGKAEGA